MGWPDAPSAAVNRNVEPNYDDRLRELHEDDRLIDRLAAWNEEDMALYESVLSLRARRLDQAKTRSARQARLAEIRRGETSPSDRESAVA
jgi:hypothetical protein